MESLLKLRLQSMLAVAVVARAVGLLVVASREAPDMKLPPQGMSALGLVASQTMSM
jgi:hypothetical protein